MNAFSRTFKICTLCFILLGLQLNAQVKGTKAPTKSDYSEGQVLVKLKPSFAYMNADGAGMRINTWSSLVPGLAVNEVTSFSTVASNPKSLASARKGTSGIDLRLYHQISFDPAIPVAEAIAKLNKSGAVELAEPVYYDKPAFTPNDPNLSKQYYIPLVNAIQGWDITKGSNSIIIAILDSGVDLTHPDLAANIYKNEADPVDGIDNDKDGYIDNYLGWDFAGSDYQTLEEDNDPSTTLDNASHGTMVAGCASAVTNNEVGIAGMGFNAKLMVLKHTADNDTRNEGSGYLSKLLLGVLYAANNGADIINASYGSTYYSQIAQDIYKYAALDKNVLIVAAAGNEDSPEAHFPSDYDYVLSVAATNQSDGRASFSNYGYKVDISAPGANIFTTDVGGGYATVNGTSFASPIVAGAAALVKTLYPDFNGAQVGEVLRVTANPSFNNNLSTTYKNKMGRGRLDVFQALTKQSPSIRMDNSVILGPGGDVPKPGQQATIYGEFINFLWPASGATVTLSSLSTEVTVVEGTISLGDMQMMQKVSNQNSPFVIRVNRGVAPNTEVVLRIDFKAANYTDYQHIKVLVNPSYYNINENLVSTTLAGNGRIGYQDTEQKQGLGFVFSDVNMLFEMGVMMGVSNSKVVSSVRSTGGEYDDDFKIINEIIKDKPGKVADVDVYGTFDDSKAPSANRLNVEVNYWGFAWREVPNEKMLVLEYEVTNKGTTPLSDFYLGLYADWDINQLEGNEGNDKAGWDAATQTGYIYTPSPTERWIGAIQVLTGKPNYWAIDNSADIANNPFGVYDGYTDEEKYRSLSSGIGRAEAGLAAAGNDVSHTVSSGPYTIPAGESVRIAFAVHGGVTIEDVLASAQQAKLLYKSVENVARPTPRSHPLGLDENEIPHLLVYPNPVKGLLNISLPEVGKDPVQVRMLDVMGRQISNVKFSAGQSNLQVKMPPTNGVYLVEITQGSKKSIRRVVVQN